jgi:two-component system sensor histidine kinase YesM
MSTFLEQIRKFFNIRLINKQIFLLTIITITIPLIIISIIVYFTSLQSVKNEYEDGSDLILNNLSFNIDQYLQSIEKGTLAIYMENDFQDTLENWSNGDLERDSYLGLQYEKSFEKFITSINMSIDHVENVRIYADDRIYFSNLFNHTVLNESNLARSTEYQEVVKAKGNLVIFGTHTPHDDPFSDKKVITIGRTVNKKGSKNRIGVLLIDIRIDALQKILHLSENSNRNFLILDTTGKAIYASDQAIIDDKMNLNHENNGLLHTLANDEGNTYIKINNSNSFINYVTSPYSGWKVIQYIDQKEMTVQAEKLQKIILLLVLSSLITAALFMYILNRRVTKPIINLSKQVDAVGKGNLQIRLNSNRQDEFGVLYKGINQMIHNLHRFIERSSALKAQQKLAHFSALKSQINPHFLANTLETLQMKAVLEEQEELSEMIGTLGQLFRISTQSGKEVVMLEEELDHIRLYIKIQQMRFGDLLAYKEEFAQGSLSIPILHFSIQPFVENAIIHGLEPKQDHCTIMIKTMLDENDLFIQIQDNGIGMTATTLGQVRDKLASTSDILEEDHIGIKNVHDQIRYYFGDAYGVSIDSVLEEGTTVTIRIPRN